MENLEAERARGAWKAVEKIAKKPEAKEYRSLVRSAPALILSNGLIQTLAFLRAKGNDPYGTLYAHLSGWIAPRIGGANASLLEYLSEADSVIHRLATREALAHISWLKRAAESIIEPLHPGKEASR